jgi:hypothetical protein
MCAAETLVSGLLMPAAASLLGLVLCVLVWLDGGAYIVGAAWQPARRDADEHAQPGSRSNFPA